MRETPKMRMKKGKETSSQPVLAGSSFLIMVFLVASFILAATSLFYPGDRYAEAVLWGVGNVTNPNNPHNLSIYSNSPIKSTTETQVCIFCHTPHSAITTGSLLNAPLWNHTLSGATYSLGSMNVPSSTGEVVNAANVGSPVLNATYMSGIQPDGDSQLCLSCHDGTVAIGSLNNPAETVSMVNVTTNGFMPTNAVGYMGTGQNSGDPILNHYFFSVPMNQQMLYSSYYNSSCVAGGTNTYYVKYPWTGDVNAPAMGGQVYLRPTAHTYPAPPNGFPGIDGSTIKGVDATDYAKADSNYYYGVQCSTCHDPHLWWTSGGSSCDFLVANACPSGPDGTTPLCLACHEAYPDCGSGPPTATNY